MIIKAEIYDHLINCPQIPPEVGGILGGRDAVIDTYVLDNGIAGASGTSYVPNVILLNECISRWGNIGISFYGIFHTHALNWPTLSKEDRKYIEQIMKAMPDEIDSLVFPIIFSGKKIESFRAVKNGFNLYITKDDIKII